MLETVRKIEQWAEDRNLIRGSTPLKQVNKTSEELNELVQALAIHAYEAQFDDGDPDLALPFAEDGIGDITVTLIIIAAQLGLKFEDCVDHAYNEIKDRKGKMVNGVFVKDI